jgi:hypothetical protein
MKLNTEELKTLIASHIKNENLNGALPDDAIERIKEKILAKNSKNSAQGIPEIVSEFNFPTVDDNLSNDDRAFPDASQAAPSPEQQLDMTGSTIPDVHVDAGAVSLDAPSEPVIGYTPELPEMLKQAAPGELFVFKYNDVGESGENLSFKPMRLMDDPDVKKSMNDLWIQEGKTKADVYVAKFEKMGEINFNYTNGTSQFTETSALPDYAGGPQYKDNPYVAASLPQIDAAAKTSLETYVKSSIDLEKVVHDIVMGIVKDSLLTNTEQAVNYPLGAIDPSDPDKPTDGMGHYIQEDIAPVEDRFGNATDNAQSVKPMEESFTLSMEEIAEGEDYAKVSLPKGLNEAISSGSKDMLIKENETMQQWGFEDKIYFTPTNRLSKTKGYIKNIKTL